MPTLYSYCLRVDTGAAPNPFWGICTLAICKPSIRRVAEIGDWIVGTGSRRSPLGDLSGTLVYAMRVSSKLTFAEYDRFARTRLPNKIPDWSSQDPRRRFGDAIYDFSRRPAALRQGAHGERERQRDLGGMYVLLSDHFFYFGDRPVRLPQRLRSLARQSPGHRSRANDRLVDPLLTWLGGLGVRPNTLQGNPQEWQRLGLAAPDRAACPVPAPTYNDSRAPG